MNGEEGLEREVHVDGIHLRHVLEIKYLTHGAECSRKVASGRRVAGAIRSLVNARGLQLEFAKVFHETLLVSVLTYGSETI